MNREEAVNEVKEHLEDYLTQHGINTRQNFYCLNPAHTTQQSHTGAKDMSYHKPSNRVVCHCGAQYDLLDLMQIQEGARDFNEALEMACKLYNIEIDEHTPLQAGALKEKKTVEKRALEETKANEAIRAAIEEAQKNIEDPAALAYLEKRGISLETARAYDLGYLSNFKTQGGIWQALIIPTGTGSYTARNINSTGKEARVQHRGAGKLFNEAALLSEAEAVHIVEGEIDALSVLEAGGQAVALCSTAQAGKLTDFLSHLETPFNKTLILSLDNDKAGLTASLKLLEGLLSLQEENKLLKNMRVVPVNISGQYKDPNEAFIEDREAFIKKLAQRVTDTEIEEYKKTTAAARLMDFYEGVNANADTPAIPTGFSFLDKQLDGGLYEGLYTIPAISSLGKTTLALQMAEAIAQQGKDVIYFSLEMAASELIAKALSRHTFLLACEQNVDHRNAKTVRGITDGKRYEKYNNTEHALIMGAYNKYEANAQHLYLQEGVGNIGAEQIRRAVEQHVAITGHTPVVFLDYLQILAPADTRATDKQNMDTAALELKRISRDFKTPVIVLSSVNRTNYHERISLEAIKESGAIEYTSDIVIGLQLEGAGGQEARKDPKIWVNEKMQEEPRNIEAVVLKNRNGVRGVSLYFSYYAMFNHFEEREKPAVNTW